MKKVCTLFTVLFIALNLFSQSPNKISYQAVVRNASGVLMSNQIAGFRISILQGATTGTAVYTETHTPTTNVNGLVSIEIGGGTPQNGAFNNIDWANGPFFIKTETDPTGGANYTISGISQLLSVPYALHAKTAESVSGIINEKDPIFNNSVAKHISSTDTTRWNNKLSIFTETDPIFNTSLAKNITATDTARWNNKLSSYTETDPMFNTSLAKNITAIDTAKWNNKLSSYTEIDPIFNSSLAKNITATDTSRWSNKLNKLIPDSSLLIINDSIKLSNPLAAGRNLGDILYWNGSKWIILPPGVSGMSLNICKGRPKWGPCMAELITLGVANVTASSAQFNGRVIDDLGLSVTEKGFCWGTVTNPIINQNNFIISGNDTGFYSSSINQLLPSTQYYIRTYAKNSAGISYGNQMMFMTTTVSLPNVNLGDTLQGGKVAYVFGPGDIGYSPHEVRGIITTISDYSASSWGCVGQLINETSTSLGMGAYNTQLISNRCDQVNSAAKVCENLVLNGYSDWYLPSKDELNKVYLQRSAIGGFGTYQPYYWSSSEVDLYYSWMHEFGSGSQGYWNWNYSKGSNFSFKVRPVRTFIISGTPGKAVFDTIYSIAITLSTFHVEVKIKTDMGQYISSKGICWSKNPNPTTSDSNMTISSGVGAYFADITGLSANTTYYIRAYAVNQSGVSYSNQIIVNTSTGNNIYTNGNGVSDIDGNFYPSVVLGSQEWMSVSLRTTRFANGDTILKVSSNAAWWAQTNNVKAYCYYNDDSLNFAQYGKLYSWNVVSDTRNACPQGWLVPTDSDWNILVNFLDNNASISCNNCIQSNKVGGLLKMSGYSRWRIPNTGSTNISGFGSSALGIRDINIGPGFTGNTVTASFWSSTSDVLNPNGHALYRTMSAFSPSLLKMAISKGNAMQIRCIKN